MEEFAQIAREHFELNQKFVAVSQHRTTSITATTSGDTSYVSEYLETEELDKGAFFQTEPLNAKREGRVLASLRLVVVMQAIHDTNEPDAPILMSKDLFLSLIDHIGIDSAALWLLMNQYNGLHRFPSPSAETIFLGVSELAIIWTFDPDSLKTKAILIPRRSNSNRLLRWVFTLLEQHQGYIHTSMLLAYVTNLALCCIFDWQILWQLSPRLRDIEMLVGYGKDSHRLQSRVDVTTLTNAIQTVGAALSHIANKELHFTIIEYILKEMEHPIPHEKTLSQEIENEINACNRKLISTFPSLRARIKASRDYLGYLKERANRLSTVLTEIQLFTLMTHEDASVNTELAESSRQIAEAAKRDSSSMKTVAIMTMAFLPGTFIAALFAIPSLDWQGENVITKQFWVYWAFTIPATALVFLIWLLLDNRTAILRVIWHEGGKEKRTGSPATKL